MSNRAISCALTLVAVGIAAGAGPAVAAPHTSVLHFGVRFGDDLVDLGAAGPSVGDQLVVHDTLVDGRGRTVGSDAGVCTFTSLRPQVASCAITFALPGGQIAVQFANRPPPRKRAAIVGGTGAYRGVRGELRIVERRNQTGRLTFRLLR